MTYRRWATPLAAALVATAALSGCSASSSAPLVWFRVSTATDRQFQSAPDEDGFAPGRISSMTDPSWRRSNVGEEDRLLQRDKKSS